jgi:hypothetical protein
VSEIRKMVKFVEVHNTGDEYFVGALKIYRDAFPPNERHSDSVIRERVTGGRSRLWVGLQKGEVVFMALLWPLLGTDFIVLDYMSTNRSQRREGIATDFMQLMRTELRDRKEFFILEVEDERYGQNVAERKERKTFYRKNGAQELKNVRYVLPPLEGDEPTQMNLMIFPAFGRDKIESTKVKSLILQMYRELYGRDASDPLLNSLSSLTGPIELF